MLSIFFGMFWDLARKGWQKLTLVFVVYTLSRFCKVAAHPPRAGNGRVRCTCLLKAFKDELVASSAMHMSSSHQLRWLSAGWDTTCKKLSRALVAFHCRQRVHRLPQKRSQWEKHGKTINLKNEKHTYSVKTFLSRLQDECMFVAYSNPKCDCRRLEEILEHMDWTKCVHDSPDKRTTCKMCKGNGQNGASDSKQIVLKRRLAPMNGAGWM